ncbi:DUF2783 domain-containing protein [Paenirhodobacter enshiensis]|uniref:DUF2783 domain-containing protein n=1 Tax=Paenirhodobacter enshiensis TaxID=1105367 RepID=UPI0035B211CD
MSALIREPNITGHDDIYEALVRLHDDLDDAASLQAWSRLTLLLINQIGNKDIVLEAIRLARR